MPNGMHICDKQRFMLLESGLLNIDSTLSDFASKHRMKLLKNWHAWPRRSLVSGFWIKRQIEIVACDDLGPGRGAEEVHYLVGISAWQDKRSGRKHVASIVRDRIAAPVLRADIEGILDEAHEGVMKWSAADLR